MSTVPMSTVIIEQQLPIAPLAPFIECLWYVRGRVPYVRDKILPMTTIELMINLGPAHKVVNRADVSQFQLHKESWISGLHTEYILTEPVAETELIGVRFKPGGAWPFLGVPVNEIRNHVVDLDLIWGSLIREVREQLAELSELGARFSVLTQLLCQRLRGKSIDTHWELVRAVAAQLSSPTPPHRIYTLSDDRGISQKHLIHLFQQIVGISPKQFQRIVRFNRLLAAVDPRQSLDWAQLAHAHHFYDQAHFNKDFLAFTGVTPSEYLRQRQKWFGPDLQPGDNVHFVPLG